MRSGQQPSFSFMIGPRDVAMFIKLLWLALYYCATDNSGRNQSVALVLLFILSRSLQAEELRWLQVRAAHEAVFRKDLKKCAKISVCATTVNHSRNIKTDWWLLCDRARHIPEDPLRATTSSTHFHQLYSRKAYTSFIMGKLPPIRY